MTAQIIYTDRFRKPREKLKLAFKRSIEMAEPKPPKDAA
jgi:hypothetical protein